MLYHIEICIFLLYFSFISVKGIDDTERAILV